MAGNAVNGSGNGARSGAQTLLLLAAPLNALLLRTLSSGPKQQIDLRRTVGFPAQTTLRAQLKHLVEINAIDKRRRNRFPGVLEYELTDAGRGLLFVIASLESWLSEGPEGPLTLSDSAARAAIKALAAGWSTTMVRALAGAPLSLTALDDVINSLSYPSLERRLAAMRLTSQVVARPGDGRATPYVVTDWLRHATAPLVAATHWEQCFRSRECPSFGRLDAEAIFLLSAPLLQLPSELSGTCRLAMETGKDKNRRLAGATVEIENGRVATCSTQLALDADSWAMGSPASWLSALMEGNDDRLEIGGNGNLARLILDRVHETLFGSITTAFQSSP